MKDSRKKESAKEKFEARKDRILRCKERNYGHTMKMQDKAASIVAKSVTSYSNALAKIIGENGNIKQHC